MNIISAGYDENGFDYDGHVHPHAQGTFITSKCISGFYCSAPVLDGECVDPPPALKKKSL